MAGDAGNSESAVEVVTQSYAITGRCSGLTEQIRLIDLLNNPEITHLQLGGVRVRELIGSQDIVTSEGPFFIDKEFIVFGRSLESAEAEEKRRQTHRVDYVEKARHQMLVFARPFRIRGTVYLFKGTDFSVALPRLFEGFLAMTETKVDHEGNAALAWESKFIVVNGRRIEMVCPAPSESGDECRADPGQAGSDEERNPEELSQPLGMR